MDRGTPATERPSRPHPSPEPGHDPRGGVRGESPQPPAPHAAHGYDEIHVEAHIILSEN